MKKSKKLSKQALEWIRPALYFQMYDCCDSMRESEYISARFDALADDEFSVDDYVLKFHRPEYIQGIKDVADENGEELITDWKEFFEGLPSTLPIDPIEMTKPIKKVKKS